MTNEPNYIANLGSKKVMEIVTFRNSSHILELMFRSHFVFTFMWVILGSIYPLAAETIGTLFLPVADAVAALYPKVSHLWHGTFSPQFYRSIASEVFFVSFLIAGFSAFSYLAKSWSQPCLLIEAIAAHTKQQKVISLAMVILLVILMGFAFVLGKAVLPIWFGLIQLEPWKPIKLYQLGLWALLTPASSFIALWIFFVITSFLAYISRNVRRTLAACYVKR